MTQIIDKFTPEQEALIPVYREKWRAKVYSPEQLDCQKAKDSIAAFYRAIGQSEPQQILFFDSLDAFRKHFASWENLSDKILICGWCFLLGGHRLLSGNEIINLALVPGVGGIHWSNQVVSRPKDHENLITRQLAQKIWSSFSFNFLENFGFLVREIASIDYCAFVLTCCHNRQVSEVLQALVLNCGLVLPCENACIICQRSIKLSL